MAARPLVRIFDAKTGSEAGNTTLPGVFTAPIRRDVVQFVHTSMAKNDRQSHAVSLGAGHQTSAQSWGTGRAVSRIPRVGGGGTSRSGQGAFGNMCRGGHMYAPTKTFRRFHRKINVNQRRYAVCSALAATAVPALVMARGHKVDEVPEVPLVLANVGDVQKTRVAYEILSRFGASADVDKAKDSKKIRAGKGKMRNRRYTMRRGPLVVFDDNSSVQKAFRNLPGVELCHVDRLNLLQLAPGGHMGRFCVWTQGAFDRLDALYGNGVEKSELKKDFGLPRAHMTNADISGIINSNDVQTQIRPVLTQKKYALRKKNPLKNRRFMDRLNPYHKVIREAEQKANAKRGAKKAKQTKERRAASRAFLKAMTSHDFVGVNGKQ